MSEHAEQCTLFEWADLMVATDQMPELANMYAIPNGGKRYKATAIKLKAEGVKSGVLDVHLPVARRDYHGLWIEMKYGRNKLTEAQQEWSARLRDLGHCVRVCYSADDAIKEATWYLGYE